jgi:F-type H+-transporting ATPase subunit b
MLNQEFLVQLAWQLINTCILCAILTKLLYKPVKKFLQDRKDKVANQIDSAQQKLEEAEALRLKYEGKLKEIESEKAEILAAARERAKLNEAQIINEAKNEAQTLKERAELDIKRAEEKAKDDIMKQIIEVSSLMTSRFIQASMTEDEQNKLVNEVISDLGEVKWQN